MKKKKTTKTNTKPKKESKKSVSEKGVKNMMKQSQQNRDDYANSKPKGFFNNVVAQVAGEDAIRIANFLKDKTNVSEFIIAEKTKIEIHKTRTLLYKMLEHNLARFNRKKDKEKGWYICYWDLTPKNANHTLMKLKKDKLEKMKDRLREEKENQYYMCKNACIRMNFEKSVDFEFKCPECGEIMNMLDNKRTIEFLEKNIGDLEKELPSAG